MPKDINENSGSMQRDVVLGLLFVTLDMNLITGENTTMCCVCSSSKEFLYWYCFATRNSCPDLFSWGILKVSENHQEDNRGEVQF